MIFVGIASCRGGTGLRPVLLFSLPAATGVAKARKVLGVVGNRNVLRKILAEY